MDSLKFHLRTAVMRSWQATPLTSVTSSYCRPLTNQCKSSRKLHPHDRHSSGCSLHNVYLHVRFLINFILLLSCILHTSQIKCICIKLLWVNENLDPVLAFMLGDMFYVNHVYSGRTVVDLNQRKGGEFFGFGHPVVQNLIQSCPGAKKCSGYKWVRYEVSKTATLSSTPQTDPTLHVEALREKISGMTSSAQIKQGMWGVTEQGVCYWERLNKKIYLKVITNQGIKLAACVGVTKQDMCSSKVCMNKEDRCAV